MYPLDTVPQGPQDYRTFLSKKNNHLWRSLGYIREFIWLTAH